MVGYFPNETWYDYETGELVNSSANSTIELAAPLDKIPVHCRGGYVIPFQHPSLTTTASRKNPFGLLIALKSNSAHGSLYWDDGVSMDSISAKNYNLFDFDVTNVIQK